jgi:hypothetical protein
VLTSPVGLAVGVFPGTGRYAGVATTEAILAGVHHRRPSQPEREAITVERAGAGDGGAHALGAEQHAGTAELGDESGHDIDPADLVGTESDLSTAEGRGPRADADDVDARR